MEAVYILIAIPFFLLLIAAELIWQWRSKRRVYRFNDAITNLNIGVGSQVFGLLFKFVLLGAYILVYEHFAQFQIATSWLSVLSCLVAYDFIFYWAHRWGHEVNFFWGAHVVHHQSEEYNLSVALRQSWFHNLLAFFLFLPIPLLGFNPETFFMTAAFHTIYQFWIHTKAIDKLPRMVEWLFNTPSHHRVHHGINPKYIDRNHGGVFIVWDRLFGTFQTEEEAPTYGITRPLASWNPTWANVHYYLDMMRSMRLMPRWRDRLKMIVAPPGWLPESLGGIQHPTPVPPEEQFIKYDARSGPWLNAYVLSQFVMIILGLAAFMHYYDTITLPFQLVFVAALVLSTMICGAIFEDRKWVLAAEYARLLLVVLSLNAYYYRWHLDWFMVMFVASLTLFVLFAGWFGFSWWRAHRLEAQPAP